MLNNPHIFHVQFFIPDVFTYFRRDRVTKSLFYFRLDIFHREAQIILLVDLYFLRDLCRENFWTVIPFKTADGTKYLQRGRIIDYPDLSQTTINQTKPHSKAINFIVYQGSAAENAIQLFHLRFRIGNERAILLSCHASSSQINSNELARMLRWLRK